MKTTLLSLTLFLGLFFIALTFIGSSHAGPSLEFPGSLSDYYRDFATEGDYLVTIRNRSGTVGRANIDKNAVIVYQISTGITTEVENSNGYEYCSNAIDEVSSEDECASFNCVYPLYDNIVLAGNYVAFRKEHYTYTCNSYGSGIYSLYFSSTSPHEVIVYDISTATASTVSSLTGNTQSGLTINGNYVMWEENGDIKSFDMSTSTSSTLLP